MQFARHEGDDADNPTNNAARALAAKALVAAGYDVYNQSANAGWIIRRHPVFPERSAIVFSAPAGASMQYHFRKKVAAPGATIIGGFSLFVPSTYKPDTANAWGGGPYPTMVIQATPDGSPLNVMVASPVLLQNELFRIRYDLLIAYGTEVQSTKYVPLGKMCYIEYRITPTEFRVWLDDVLVLQKTLTANPSNIAMGIMSWPSGNPSISAVALADGRWAVADWYNLLEDATAPNVRLGPTTRVIGVLPAADEVAQFIRPPGYASNAAVAARPLNPDSDVLLKTDTIGATDIYTGAPDNETGSASLVHAVGVKVIAQNLEGSAHTLRATVNSGASESGTTKALPAALGSISHVTAIDPATGLAWTPGAAATARFGMKLVS